MPVKSGIFRFELAVVRMFAVRVLPGRLIIGGIVFGEFFLCAKCNFYQIGNPVSECCVAPWVVPVCSATRGELVANDRGREPLTHQFAGLNFHCC